MKTKLFTIVAFAAAINCSAQVVTTLAGHLSSGSANGTGTAASFNNPSGVAIDGSGNLYVADLGNNLIRKIVIATGVVTTLAGSGAIGSANGTGTAASFNTPIGVAIDGSGNLYVADAQNNEIRKIVIATGVVTTLAGSTTAGSADGTGTAASFHTPGGICIDASGNLYVADVYNFEIRKIVIATGVVTTLAGSSTNPGYTNGIGAAASFMQLGGVAVDGSGNLYVADTYNYAIRKIVIATGAVTTLAGTGATGSANGTGTAASFYYPSDVASDGSGNLYVADGGNNEIRKIVISSKVVTTLAGSTTSGSANGTGAAARFNSPYGICSDGSGNLYVADASNNEIRQVTTGQAGIEGFASNNIEATIYPNPATTVLNVELGIMNGTNQLTMYDMLGNSIYHATFTTQHNTISVADLAAGIYNISITSNEGIINKRIIITK